MKNTPLYGLTAEFGTCEVLKSSLSRLLNAGFTRIEVLSPVPDDEMTQLLSLPPSRLPMLTFSGGLMGALLGYGLQYYTAVIQYPLDIGGRPLNSWPAFVPITFECCIFGAAVAAFIGFFVASGLPRLYHPLFNVDEFSKVTNDRFFITIEATDPVFDLSVTRELLLSSGASEVHNVPL